MATMKLRKAVLNLHIATLAKRRICSAPTNTRGPSFLRNAIYSLTSASSAEVSTRSFRTFGDGMAGRKTVVVDGLYYLTFFLPITEPENETQKLGPWELYEVSKQRTNAFLVGCRIAGIHPIFVLDNGYQSVEATEKWKSRRADEVTNEFRRMPCNAGIYH